MCLLVLKKVFHERLSFFYLQKLFRQTYIIFLSAIAASHAFNPQWALKAVTPILHSLELFLVPFRHGPFAEQILVPTENAIRIGSLDEADAARWCGLGAFLVPYGGLLAANLQAGETILISGATDNFGSAAVAVALAMGARCVVAPGRNEKTFKDLTRRFGARLRPVKLLGDEEDDQERMRQAAPGPIDCVLDILPPSVSTTTVRAAIMTVRPYGRVVLMGGVGMLGGAGLELPYPWIMRNCITLRLDFRLKVSDRAVEWLGKNGTGESPGCNTCDRSLLTLRVGFAPGELPTLLRSPPPHGGYTIAVSGTDI
ncbi:MAG: zinc-binding dehydrogenase [Nostoc sp.]|uniref:zinc-binding dehydrogenase n=1 Tax=Nostoc sp. TaxID=1180 RepID=UPI002FF4B836